MRSKKVKYSLFIIVTSQKIESFKNRVTLILVDFCHWGSETVTLLDITAMVKTKKNYSHICAEHYLKTYNFISKNLIS